MQNGKLNCILDAFWGSSGKGKTSAWLADHFNVKHISSSNFPNAGHTAAFEDGTKFIAKAIPTAAVLRKVKGTGIQCYISPGSGFAWPQLIKEWQESGRPDIIIHSRASIVTDSHKLREASGAESTKHIASTMQGSGTAIADKVLRKADCILAGSHDLTTTIRTMYEQDSMIRSLFLNDQNVVTEFLERVNVMEAQDFRNVTHSILKNGQSWLHEGSQGYALSIDHGSHFPFCTSRNCSVQGAMDHMAVPHQLMGDVYLNLRSFPIRVGNFVEDGIQKGYSGDFYPDCKEWTWEQVAAYSGMPESEAKALSERERTTVTKRIRRVTNFSFEGLRDAVQTNGATKLVMNFIQYISWSDNQLRDFKKLSSKSREFIDRVEAEAGIPVVLVGTGALHGDMIVRSEYM